MEKNKNNGVLLGVVIGLLIGIIIGLVIFIITDKKEDNKNNNNDKKQTEEKVNKDDKKKDDNKKSDTEDISDQSFDLANFDGSKIINKKNNTIKYITESVKEAPYSMEGKVYPEVMNSTNQDVKVRINWNNLCYLNGESKDYPYGINVGSDIKTVYVGGWGQAAGNESLFYLLNDGTIKYTPITCRIGQDALANPDNKTLQASEVIPNIDGIVMLATVQVGSTNGGAGGYATTIAIKADGTFYDLREELLSTGLYN